MPVPLPSSASSAITSTITAASPINVAGSIGAPNVINPILPVSVPLNYDLSLLPDSCYPLPSSATTCINVSNFSSLLSGYPSKLIDFLTTGFSSGFRIGFLGNLSPGRDKNNLSAYRHAGDVSVAVMRELRRGHTAGPFSLPPFANFHCSPLGAVPKKDNTIRIILDLSSSSERFL